MQSKTREAAADTGRLTVLLPVTRPWTMDAVCESIAASDIPRGRLVLVLDAPGCEPWEPALRALGFDVEVYATGQELPPDGNPYIRRPRQQSMREFTLPLVGDGPILCLDDDAVVPPDVFERLSAIGPHACAVQVSRYGGRYCGVYRDGRPLKRRHGVEEVDACGHYCVLTTGEMYRLTAVASPGRGEMKPIPGLRVDWDCVCGHLTSGGVLWP